MICKEEFTLAIYDRIGTQFIKKHGVRTYCYKLRCITLCRSSRYVTPLGRCKGGRKSVLVEVFPNIKCRNCEKEFTPVHHTQRHCSTECRELYQDELQHSEEQRRKGRECKQKFRTQMFEVLGNGGCVECGIMDRRCLQFDHINGGGLRQQKWLRGSSYNVLKYYINQPQKAREEIQILCVNHNWIKMDKNPHWRRIQLFDILGHRCVRCGETDKRALQFDHINGRGRSDIKKYNSNCAYYTFYVKRPDLARDTLQVLCANCNWIKRYENGEHPGYLKTRP